MNRLFLFADEAGNFNFSRQAAASKYYIVCTISCDSCDIGTALLALRRELIWDRAPVGEYFHASEDKQAIRDRVFQVLQQQNFSIQATIMEKSKAQPQVRVTEHRFYHYGWYYHFQYAAPKVLGNASTEFHVTTAAVGTQRGQGVFTRAVNDVVQRVIKNKNWRTNFCRSVADPCLQAADYCTWAIQRKWERADTKSYDLIKDKIVHEVDMWSHGGRHYY